MMNMIKAVNLGLRFFLELCLLAAAGYWGFQLHQSWPLRLLAGLGMVLLVAGTWGLFVAPKARRRLADPWRFLLELVLFGLGAGLLVVMARPYLAAALCLTYLLNRLLMAAWGQSHM